LLAILVVRFLARCLRWREAQIVRTGWNTFGAAVWKTADFDIGIDLSY
jgi:hypothetical protein